MALTHVQLYEALKPSVGEEAARMMADVVPPAENLATRDYIDAVRAALEIKIAELHTKIAEVVGEMREGFAKVEAGFATLDAKIEAEGKHTLRWMIGLFIPLWGATFGAMIIALLKLS
jgi:hypothetical protein